MFKRLSVVAVIGLFLVVVLQASSAQAATLSGTVSGQAPGQPAQPLAEATVTLLDPSTGNPVDSTSTGPAGDYSIAAPSGSFDVRFESAPSASFEATTVHGVDLSTPRTLSVILTPAGTVNLTGTLRDASGNPVPGVTLLLSTGFTPALSTQTAADGSYAFAAVPGSYELYAYSGKPVSGSDLPNSWFLQTAKVNLDSDQSRDIALPSTATLTVEALGKEDAPVAGAGVRVGDLDGSAAVGGFTAAHIQTRGLSSSTGSDGRASFIVFKGGTPLSNQETAVNPPAGSGYGHTPFKVPQVDQDTTVVVQALPVVNLTGTLRDASGNPVPGVTLLLSTGFTPALSTQTAADGSYAFAAVPGSYELYAYSGKPVSGSDLPNSWFLQTAKVNLDSDQSRDIALPSTATLTVEALGKEDAPVAGAGVRVGDLDGSAAVGGFTAAHIQTRGLSSSTGSDGRASFIVFKGGTPLSNQETAVNPPAGSGYGHTPFKVPQVDQDTTVVVQALPVVNLTGTLRDASGNPVPGVTLLLSTGFTPALSTQTAADGSYAFAAVPGSYELYAYSGKPVSGSDLPNSWFLQTAKVNLDSDQSRDIALPSTATLTVEALGKEDAPVAGAGVRVGDLDGSAAVGGFTAAHIQTRGLSSSTGSDGRASFIVFKGGTPLSNQETAVNPPAGSGYGHTPFKVPQVDQDTTVVVRFQTNPPPAVSKINPVSGPEAGGTAVEISGSGFAGATAVRFGTTAAVSMTVDSASSITATAPAGSGTVDVTVTTPSGTSSTSAADRYRYSPPIALTSAPNPSTYGQKATFTAKVSPATKGAPAPTGTVTFTEGSTNLGVATLSKGVATFSSSSLAAGSHTLVATYGGDSYFGPSQSAGLGQNVKRAATQLTLTSAKNPAPYGYAGNLKATVKALAPGTGTPTGTVTFGEGATTLATVSLVSGSAQLPLKTLAPGNHEITATYNGAANYETSGSVINQAILKAATQLTLTSAKNPAPYGYAGNLKATVKALAPGTGTPTGTVTFGEGATTLATVSLVSGSAQLPLKTLAPGNHEITATYNGAANYETSGSVINQAILKAATQLTLTSAKNPAPYGYAGNLKATVKALAPGTGTPTGTVTFGEGATTLATVSLVSGSAQLPLKTLAPGNHEITATYNGAANYETSGSVINQAITP